MDITTIIGDNIRGFRNQRKWTQARLAEESGLNGGYIGEIERGYKNITALKLYNIAKALKIDIRQFFIERAYQSTEK